MYIYRQMAQTFYTQTLTSDGSNLALNEEPAGTSPYVTYKCKNEVNLNFLFREILFCDPEAVAVGPDDAATGSDKMHIVPAYLDATAAEAAADADRVIDVSSSVGHNHAMRFIDALVRTELKSAVINSAIEANLNFLGGYGDGLASGSSFNTSSPSTATMDLGEFFQVALSAVRNKETNAATTGTNGLVDRENINNAAVHDDLMARDLDDVTGSALLHALVRSANQNGTFASGLIDTSSGVNWMKQLVYGIVVASVNEAGSEATERYQPLRRTNVDAVAGNSQERFMQLKLQDGDSIVVVFQFTLSDAAGNAFNNECPDAPGTAITVGFRIQHSDAAPEFLADAGNTGSGSIVPVGWEVTV
jgi:hypothetical protein